MTYETCERLAKHHRELGDEETAKMYEERAARKRAKHGVSDSPTKSKGKK